MKIIIELFVLIVLKELLLKTYSMKEPVRNVRKNVAILSP